MAAITLKDLMDPLTRIATATENTSSKINALAASISSTNVSQKIPQKQENGGGILNSLKKETVPVLNEFIGTMSNFVNALILSKKISTSDTNNLVITLNQVFAAFNEADPNKVEKGAEAFAIMAGTILPFSQALAQSNKFLKVGNVAVSYLQSAIKQIMAVFDGINVKDAKTGAEAFEIMSRSILPFSKALAESTFYLIPGSIGVILFSDAVNKITPTFLLIGKNEKEISNGALALSLMSRSMMRFAKSMIIVSIASAVTILFIPIIAANIFLMSKLFAFIGKSEKQINLGARALSRMGSSLIKFSIGLATFAVVSYAILQAPAVLLVMVGSLVLIGGALALIGTRANLINRGSRALAVAGLGLGIFSLGYFMFAMVAKPITLMDILVQAGILGGIGLITGLIGKGYKHVLLGSLSLLAMGASLAVFSLGYMLFTKATENVTLKDIGIQLATLGGLGVVFALAGLGVAATGGLAFLGPLFFAAVGGSLILLAMGLGAMKALNFTEADSKNLVTALAGVRAAFLGGDTGNEGIFAKLGGVLTGAIDSVRMGAAAAGFAAAGLSLTALAKGLSDFKKIGWDNKLSEELTIVLSGITSAFAQAGGEPANPGGIFGMVFGNIFSPNAVKRGINSVMGAGKALTQISKGLKSFQELTQSQIEFGEPDSNGNYERGTLGYSVVNTLGFIQRAFASIAEEGNVQGGGFFAGLLGIKRNKVREGIKSVRGAGKALNDIASGLKGFQELVKSEIDWKELGTSIEYTLGFVQNAFAAIGGGPKTQAGGFFGSLFGIEKNTVQEGINSVKGAGKALNDIVSGLKGFQELVKSNINWTELGDIIKKSLTLVGDAFAAIGGKTKTESALLGLIKWDENLVRQGIKNVKGAGTELINIARGLQEFSSLKNPQAIADSIKTIFTSIGDTFTFYYEKPKFKSNLDHMRGFITQISVNAEKGLLHKSADGMKKIAEAVNSIDKSKAEAFANLFKGAGGLSENKLAYQQLLQAVEDIKSLLSGGGATGGANTPTGPVNNNTNTQPQGAAGDIKPLLEAMNGTLNRLNSSINSLPASIQALQIVVSD
jgi:hypothetical protein